MRNIFGQLDSIVSALNLSTIRHYMRDYNNTAMLKAIKENPNDLRKMLELMFETILKISDPEMIIYDWYNPPEDLDLTPSEKEAWSALHLIMSNIMITYMKLEWNFEEYLKTEKYFSDWERYAVKIAKSSDENFQKFKKGFVNYAKPKFDSIISEAEANYKRYVKNLYEETRKATPRVKMDTAYSEFFHGKYRIVLPKKINGKFLYEAKKDFRNHYDFFTRMNILLSRYFLELGKFEEYNSVSKLTFNSVKDFEDYLETGVYTFKSMNRQMRIGKLLEGIKKVVLPTAGDDLKDLYYSVFQQYMTRDSAKGDLVIVLSRHPYDIAGMSTGRGWTSCMNLFTGMYKEYVDSSIKAGVLIAYLCSPNDKQVKISKYDFRKTKKINIQHPLGRCLVKPYTKHNRYEDETEADFSNPNWILRCSKTYGTFFDAAVKYLQEWLNENWNDRIVKEFGDGSYEFNSNFYFEPDDDESHIYGDDYRKEKENYEEQ